MKTYPSSRNVFRIVAQHAQERPAALALSGFGLSWTYSELREQAQSVAQALSRMGLEAGGRIAMVADNHPLTCLIYVAAARMGGIVSLVNSMFRAEELAGVLRKLAPQVVILDSAHREVVDTALARSNVQASLAMLVRSRDAAMPFVEDWTKGSGYQGAEPTVEDVFEISWTSGTTSAPKGVVLTHDTAIYRAEKEVELFQLSSEDAAAVITPLFHQSGIRNTVLTMWLCGGHAVVLPKFDLSTVWEDLKRYRITYLCMVETILLLLDRNPPCALERSNDLRVVLAAGDPDVVRRCEQRFGFRVVQVWGMTETGVTTGVTQTTPMDDVNELRDWGRGAPLAGWPVSEDTKIRLMDGHSVVTESGIAGEIQVCSGLLFSNYYEDEDATSAAFQGVWFKTGDLGMFGPGRVLYFLDRIKDVIRRGGENIASKQVEDVLGAHPKVDRAAVIAVPDPLFLQEVKAIVVLNTSVTADELWSWCDERLARYKVPRYIEFRDSLPLNSSGRVQKQLLSANGASGNGIVFDRRVARESA